MSKLMFNNQYIPATEVGWGASMISHPAFFSLSACWQGLVGLWSKRPGPTIKNKYITIFTNRLLKVLMV